MYLNILGKVQMNEQLNTLTKCIIDLQEMLRTQEILLRTNNIIMSRFILELNNLMTELKIPRHKLFFKFAISDDDYDLLVKEFDSASVDKALIKLDKLLMTNKQDCPNNIYQYTRARLKQAQRQKLYDGKNRNKD